MTDKTVNDLVSLASPAADDWVAVWDVSAGQFVKIRRDVLLGATITGGGTIALGGFTLTVPASMTAAGRDVANTFSQPQTIPQIKTTRVVIANNGTQALGGVFGLAIVGNASDGGQALLWLSVGIAAIIAQIGTNIGVTQGTAGKLNVYAAGGIFYIENKIGASKSVDYVTLCY